MKPGKRTDPPRWSEYVPVDDLVPALRNAKNHADVDIAGSLERFGYIEPIVLDERTGRMVGGHGRREQILARRAAGQTPPEGVTDDWRVIVNRGWASKDDAEADAAAVALNRAGEVGGWIDPILTDVLGTIASTPAGLDGTGYTLGQWDDLQARLDIEVVLPPEPTDAHHLDSEAWAQRVRDNGGGHTKAGDGLHEVVIVLQGDAYREYQEHLAKLRKEWDDPPIPLIVLKAMEEAVGQ